VAQTLALLRRQIAEAAEVLAQPLLLLGGRDFNRS